MSATSKIQRSANAPRVPADELEVSIGQALIDLQASVADLKWAKAILAKDARRTDDIDTMDVCAIAEPSSLPFRSALPKKSRSREAARLSSCRNRQQLLYHACY